MVSFLQKKGVDITSASEDLVSLVKEFGPDRLFGGLIMGKVLLDVFSFYGKAIQNDFSDIEIKGEILKCKACGAYHVYCDNCHGLSLVVNRPHLFDKIKCQHCSKTVTID